MSTVKIMFLSRRLPLAGTRFRSQSVISPSGKQHILTSSGYRPISSSGNHPQMEKPPVTIPLNVDRLRCCMTILESLFQLSKSIPSRFNCVLILPRSDIQRPVQIPVVPLVAFLIALLTLNNEERWPFY